MAKSELFSTEEIQKLSELLELRPEITHQEVSDHVTVHKGIDTISDQGKVSLGGELREYGAKATYTISAPLIAWLKYPEDHADTIFDQLKARNKAFDISVAFDQVPNENEIHEKLLQEVQK